MGKRGCDIELPPFFLKFKISTPINLINKTLKVDIIYDIIKK